MKENEEFDLELDEDEIILLRLEDLNEWDGDEYLGPQDCDLFNEIYLN